MFCYSKAALLPLSAMAAALWLAAGPGAARAQARPPSVQRAEPADPKAAVPQLVYRSSLSRFQAFTEPDDAPWRETNELVRQRGGWRAYAREAREPVTPTVTTPAATPAASQPAADAKPAIPGHAGHEMK